MCNKVRSNCPFSLNPCAASLAVRFNFAIFSLTDDIEIIQNGDPRF